MKKNKSRENIAFFKYLWKKACPFLCVVCFLAILLFTAQVENDGGDLGVYAIRGVVLLGTMGILVKGLLS